LVRVMKPWVRAARTLIAVTGGLLALAASPVHANSGSITNIAPTGTGTIQATFSIDWSYCKDYGYGIQNCAWYAAAYWRPIGSDCVPDTGALLWVGSFHSTSGTETTTATFYPRTDQAFHICLYVKPSGADPYLVSLNSYWPPPKPQPTAAPSPPAPAPPSAPPSATPITFTLSEAQVTLRRIIRRETRRSPRRLKFNCHRDDMTSFTCRPVWADGTFVYAGTMEITEDEDGYGYRFDGLRARISCVANRSVRSCARRVRW
jgi:hypothetical protein